MPCHPGAQWQVLGPTHSPPFRHFCKQLAANNTKRQTSESDPRRHTAFNPTDPPGGPRLLQNKSFSSDLGQITLSVLNLLLLFLSSLPEKPEGHIHKTEQTLQLMLPRCEAASVSRAPRVQTVPQQPPRLQRGESCMLRVILIPQMSR